LSYESQRSILCLLARDLTDRRRHVLRGDRFVDHYNRTHPEITYDLPKTADELQTPPPVRTWRCDGQIIEAVSNPFPDRCVAFDVKG
jgi:hypothetical protein